LRKNLSCKKLIIFISSSNKINTISQINTRVFKDVQRTMPSDLPSLLPSIFVPLIGIAMPAVFIVLIGRLITATE